MHSSVCQIAQHETWQKWRPRCRLMCLERKRSVLYDRLALLRLERDRDAVLRWRQHGPPHRPVLARVVSARDPGRRLEKSHRLLRPGRELLSLDNPEVPGRLFGSASARGEWTKTHRQSEGGGTPKQTANACALLCASNPRARGRKPTSTRAECWRRSVSSATGMCSKRCGFGGSTTTNTGPTYFRLAQKACRATRWARRRRGPERCGSRNPPRGFPRSSPFSRSG